MAWQPRTGRPSRSRHKAGTADGTRGLQPGHSSPLVATDVGEDELLPADIGLDFYGCLLSEEERVEVSRNLLGFVGILLEMELELKAGDRTRDSSTLHRRPKRSSR